MIIKTGRILVLGGYGNFGKHISEALAKADIPIIIAGRNRHKAQELASKLNKAYPSASVETAIFDVGTTLEMQLPLLKPTLVINTCGPFQLADYSVAEACIKHQIHYIDLADGRDFVCGITRLDAKAKAANVLVISGASTVPGLSSAVLEAYKEDFTVIDSLVYGICPGAKAPRGLATAKSILSYVGKPLAPFAGNPKAYGWQDLYLQDYPILGKRWMANCDVPDLDLLPARYNITSIRFSAGMESSLLHLGIWLMSWCIRLGLPLHLPDYAESLLKISRIFDCFGTSHGGMHMQMKGNDKQGNRKEITWFMIAKDGDGPRIPCVPAIVLAKKLVAGELQLTGAMPCVGVVTLEEYRKALEGFACYESTRSS